MLARLASPATQASFIITFTYRVTIPITTHFCTDREHEDLAKDIASEESAVALLKNKQQALRGTALKLADVVKDEREQAAVLLKQLNDTQSSLAR